MIDLNDRLPKHLLKVIKDPVAFLDGPENGGEKQKFGIVGAGAAGLLSAYLLLKVGHSVIIQIIVTIQVQVKSQKDLE